LQQRLRTPFAEVDLLFRREAGALLMVEVKTLSRFDFLLHRISPRQKERLFRARLYLQSQYREAVEINWAYVSHNGDVLVIEDVCG
jgi:putative endonuclease